MNDHNQEITEEPKVIAVYEDPELKEALEQWLKERDETKDSAN